jgi:hypothetical protein
MEAALPPLLHEYEEAPLAVKVAVCPLQITLGLELALTVGIGLTEIVRVEIAEHPPVVPVTE